MRGPAHTWDPSHGNSHTVRMVEGASCASNTCVLLWGGSLASYIDPGEQARRSSRRSADCYGRGHGTGACVDASHPGVQYKEILLFSNPAYMNVTCRIFIDECGLPALLAELLIQWASYLPFPSVPTIRWLRWCDVRFLKLIASLKK